MRFQIKNTFDFQKLLFEKSLKFEVVLFYDSLKRKVTYLCKQWIAADFGLLVCTARQTQLKVQELKILDTMG